MGLRHWRPGPQATAQLTEERLAGVGVCRARCGVGRGSGTQSCGFQGHSRKGCRNWRGRWVVSQVSGGRPVLVEDGVDVEDGPRPCCGLQSGSRVCWRPGISRGDCGSLCFRGGWSVSSGGCVKTPASAVTRSLESLRLACCGELGVQVAVGSPHLGPPLGPALQSDCLGSLEHASSLLLRQILFFFV